MHIQAEHFDAFITDLQRASGFFHVFFFALDIARCRFAQHGLDLHAVFLHQKWLTVFDDRPQFLAAYCFYYYAVASFQVISIVSEGIHFLRFFEADESQALVAALNGFAFVLCHPTFAAHAAAFCISIFIPRPFVLFRCGCAVFIFLFHDFTSFSSYII